MKYFLSLSSETHTLYRGAGEGSDSRFIEWWSSEKSLAERYTRSRIDGKLSTKTFSFNRVLSLSHDNFVITPKQLVMRAFTPIRKLLNTKDAIAASKEFESKFPKSIQESGLPVKGYMEYPKYKKALSELLQKYGYDAISILEDGVRTYGVLK